MSQAAPAQTGSVALITPRGERRARGGHPWIYRSDVAEVHAAPGDIVKVLGTRGGTVGYAFWSDRSQISLRMLTHGDVVADAAMIDARLRRALAYRDELALDANACRLVHAEGDLLPGLVVDRYADCLVVQTLSQGMDRLLPFVTERLVEMLRPAGILARNDPKVRTLEGLEPRVDVLHGVVPDLVPVHEGSVTYEVDLRRGQKTGLFLDQRENREAAARYARGRLLDGFSYNGGFALALAPRCTSVEALDISSESVARITANANRNGLPHVQAREVNVFDELRRLEKAGARYDTIVLDPPAFAKNKAAIPNALAGYKEINLRALHLLVPGGYLVTCSCSYNVTEDMFAAVLHEVSVDSHVPVTAVEKRMQGRDHPVLVGAPETYYLKCFILRRVE
jgi:23S rRNA (cytosine1962-C5)-methyltransferase